MPRQVDAVACDGERREHEPHLHATRPPTIESDAATGVERSSADARLQIFDLQPVAIRGERDADTGQLLAHRNYVELAV
jgi:hypothetical protein